VPVPAVQLLSEGLVPSLLAFSMAPCRLHSEELPGSSVVLTIIVLDVALTSVLINTTPIGTSAMSKTMKAGRAAPDQARLQVVTIARPIGSRYSRLRIRVATVRAEVPGIMSDAGSIGDARNCAVR